MNVNQRKKLKGRPENVRLLPYWPESLREITQQRRKRLRMVKTAYIPRRARKGV